MKASSLIFESWDTIFAECFVIGGRYHPHSRWSHCSRYVAYEPGCESFCPAQEKQQGRFTFEAKALADLITEECGENLDPWPEYQALYSWLSRADPLDERVTRLPNGTPMMTFWIEKLLELDACRVFCRSCGRNISGKLIREMPNVMRRMRILCPSIHVVLTSNGRRFHQIRLSGEVLPPSIEWTRKARAASQVDAFLLGEKPSPPPRPKTSGKLLNRYQDTTIRICWAFRTVEISARPILRLEEPVQASEAG